MDHGGSVLMAALVGPAVLVRMLRCMTAGERRTNPSFRARGEPTLSLRFTAASVVRLVEQPAPVNEHELPVADELPTRAGLVLLHEVRLNQCSIHPSFDGLQLGERDRRSLVESLVEVLAARELRLHAIAPERVGRIELLVHYEPVEVGHCLLR